MAAAAVPPVVRARLQRAVDARSEPYQQGSQLYVGRPRVLVRSADGAVTPAGRAYQELLAARGGGPQRGEHLGWYHHNAPMQHFLGHMFARDRSGQRHLVRRWNPARGSWDFTAAGRRFYEHEQTRVEVNIPVYAHFRHKRVDSHGRAILDADGNVQYVEASYNRLQGQPVTVPLDLGGEDEEMRLNLPQDLNWVRHTGDLARMKGFVERAIRRYIDRLAQDPANIDPHSGRVILRDFSQSDAKYTFDPARLGDFRGFTFSAEGVQTVRGHVAPHVEVILDEPLRGHPELPDEMWHAMDLLPQATMDLGGDCVRQQLVLCVCGRDQAGGMQKKNAKQLLTLDDLGFFFDTAEEHCYPGLRSGETYRPPPPPLPQIARQLLEPFVEPLAKYFSPVQTKKLSVVMTYVMNHGADSFDGASLPDALRAAFPVETQPRLRYLAFFRGFPEVFRVYTPVGAEARVARWVAYAPVDEALRQGPKPEPYLSGTWREVGISAHMITMAADELGRPLVVFHNNAKVFQSMAPEGNKGAAIVLNVWEGHAYMYKPGQASRDAQNTKVRWDTALPLRLVGRGDRERTPLHEMLLYSEVEFPLLLDWLYYGKNIERVRLEQPRWHHMLRDPESRWLVNGKPKRWYTANLEMVLGFFRQRPTESRRFTLQVNYREPNKPRSVVFQVRKHKVRLLGVPENWKALQNLFSFDRSHFGGWDIQYCGEGQGTVAARLVSEVMGRRRVSRNKAEIIAAQNGCCAGCGERVDRLEIHHIHPFALDGADDAGNLEALCRACHEDKTAEQRASGAQAYGGVESELSPRMLAMFLLDAPKPRQQHWGGLPRGEAWCLDVNGCRRNALLDAPSLPQFGPADEFMPFSAVATNTREHLARYHYFWVRREQYSFAPQLDDDERDLYDGEHPYCLPAVLEMLDSGIIGLSNILYAARASREILPERLEDAFEYLNQEDWGAVDPPPSFKTMALSAIGVWTRVLNLEWERADAFTKPDRVCCGLEDGARPSGWKCTRRIGCRTAYPLGLLALQCEQVRVFRGLRILREFGATVHGVLTDGIFFDTLRMEAEEREFRACGSELTQYESQEIAKISRECVRAQLEDRLEGERYKNLERRTEDRLKRIGLNYCETVLPVYKIFLADKGKCPVQERVHLEQSRSFPVSRPWTTLAETDHARRDRLVADARPMQCLFRRLHPMRRHFPEGIVRLIAAYVGDKPPPKPSDDAAGDEPPPEPEPEWVDTPGFCPIDISEDHFAKLADLLIHNGGGMVLGPGGVGKTTLVTGRTEKLADGTEVKIPGLISRWKRREPDAQFVTTAMMHVAARLLPGGRTLAHKLQRLQYGGSGLSKTVFVIDEISQIPLSAWALIGEWYSLGARFVLLGDFYQFLPIKDQWADSAVSVEHADILRQLARSLRIEMTVPRRSRDPKLFRDFTSLYPAIKEADPEMQERHIERLLAQYPWRSENPALVLVVSHAKRIRLNAYYNQLRDKTPGAVFVPCAGAAARSSCQGQDMWVRPGQLLQGCSKFGAKILNAVLYIVKSASDDGIVVEMHPTYRRPRVDAEGKSLKAEELEQIDKLEADIELTLAETAQLLRLAHVMCYASVQGRTVDDHILLLDLAHRHFQLRTLNVGMSRATHGKYVHLATRGEEYVLLSHAPQVQRPAAAAPPEQRREDSGGEEAAEWRLDSDTESE